jgi:hypothetical protein
MEQCFTWIFTTQHSRSTGGHNHPPALRSDQKQTPVIPTAEQKMTQAFGWPARAADE